MVEKRVCAESMGVRALSNQPAAEDRRPRPSLQGTHAHASVWPLSGLCVASCVASVWPLGLLHLTSR